MSTKPVRAASSVSALGPWDAGEALAPQPGAFRANRSLPPLPLGGLVHSRDSWIRSSLCVLGTPFHLPDMVCGEKKGTEISACTLQIAALPTEGLVSGFREGGANGVEGDQ